MVTPWRPRRERQAGERGGLSGLAHGPRAPHRRHGPARARLDVVLVGLEGDDGVRRGHRELRTARYEDDDPLTVGVKVDGLHRGPECHALFPGEKGTYNPAETGSHILQPA
ncbi:hypothetical protein Psi02_76390 [Planotetraspora silvatica]|uniref:Uncharacterized protein n=1 Tax=Planotetraspora silvatica TaxID=234614 RepID=A0A8J3XSJ8_9ACTN|nr:hypothetical protein Psi02_76390 [Planotetraspora silvatica]